MNPQSCAHVNRVTRTVPLASSTSTSATVATIVSPRVANATPRGVLGQDADPYVRELMQTPRRQAERLHDLIAGPAA